MSKVTKKQLHNGWHCHDTEIIKMKKELRELKQSVLRLEKLTDEKLLDKPQLKQLDQSVFDGLDEKWRFAAVDANGFVHVYDETPRLLENLFHAHKGMEQEWFGTDYDTSNWQNSLIERDIAKEPAEVDLSSELTGSELCKAMLARGDTRIMCEVYDDGNRNDLTHVIRAYSDDKFHTKANRWSHAIPINNQGKPLTASEVGL